MEKNKKLSIVIFRNNLRTIDNIALQNSLQQKNNVICLYPLEILEGFEFGFAKCGKYRKEFIYETLLQLQSILDKKNISLFFVNDIHNTLLSLTKNFNIEIYFEKEVGIDEKEFEKKLEKYPHKSYFYQTMLEPFEFNYSNSFTKFRKTAEQLSIQEPLGDIEPLKQNIREVDIQHETLQLKNIDLPFKGGQTHAIQRVEYYLDNYLHQYLDTRSLVDGENSSTKFSPYLSIGAISARFIYQKLKQYEQKHGKSKSSYWIYFELLWRDFFYMVLLQSKNKMFLKSGIQDKKLHFKEDVALLDIFFNANTQIDIIDAGIKELQATGWISNRQRQLLASYFTKNLGLDFRYGAAFFEKYLIDYNPASNYGNWNYQAGVGNDKSYRVFDPIKQSKLYNGKEYIKKWLKREEKDPSIDYIAMAKDIRYTIYDAEKLK